MKKIDYRDKRKRNKFLRKFIMIFIIFVIILLVYLINLLHKNDKNYMKKFLDKGIKNINYSYIDTNKTETYVINNQKKSVYSDGTILYSNYDTKEKIVISTNDKTIDRYTNINLEDSPHHSKYLKIFNDEKYEYSYEKIEKLDDVKCYVITFTNSEKGYDGAQLKYRFWINKKLGVIEKICTYALKDEEEKLLSETLYNMHTGDVSEEDVKKPDLSLYSDYKIINN